MHLHFVKSSCYTLMFCKFLFYFSFSLVLYHMTSLSSSFIKKIFILLRNKMKNKEIMNLKSNYHLLKEYDIRLVASLGDIFVVTHRNIYEKVQ